MLLASSSSLAWSASLQSGQQVLSLLFTQEGLVLRADGENLLQAFREVLCNSSCNSASANAFARMFMRENVTLFTAHFLSIRPDGMLNSYSQHLPL